MNYHIISGRSGFSINTVKNYIGYLSDAQLILQLHHEAIGLGNLGKPEKIYLHNTKLMYNLIGNNVDLGNLRETFFFSQVSQVTSVNASAQSDFLVNGKYTFEIGGKNKGQKQINGLPDSYLAKDDIEVGYENVIPLWMFGMMY